MRRYIILLGYFALTAFVWSTPTPITQAVMTKGIQNIDGVKTFTTSLITSPGAPILIGTTNPLQWPGTTGPHAALDALVSIQDLTPNSTTHGLIVHTSGTQGNAIIGFSESGASGVKAWQKTYATSTALIVGRSDLLTPDPLHIGMDTLTPLVVAHQPAAATASLVKLRGSGTLEVKANGSVTTTGDVTAKSFNTLPWTIKTSSPVNAVSEGRYLVNISSSTVLLNTPTGGTQAGNKVRYFITSDTSCVLTLDAGIKIASYGTLFPGTFDVNKLYIVELEYSGSFWMLESIIGGFE